jgi:hypothetical protein
MTFGLPSSYCSRESHLEPSVLSLSSEFTTITAYSDDSPSVGLVGACSIYSVHFPRTSRLSAWYPFPQSKLSLRGSCAPLEIYSSCQFSPTPSNVLLLSVDYFECQVKTQREHIYRRTIQRLQFCPCRTVTPHHIE